MILAILTIILILFNRLFEETTHSVVSSIKAGTYFMNNKIEENKTHTADTWLVITPFRIEDPQNDGFNSFIYDREVNPFDEKWIKPHRFMDLYDIPIIA